LSTCSKQSSCPGLTTVTHSPPDSQLAFLSSLGPTTSITTGNSSCCRVRAAGAHQISSPGWRLGRTATASSFEGLRLALQGQRPAQPQKPHPTRRMVKARPPPAHLEELMVQDLLEGEAVLGVASEDAGDEVLGRQGEEGREGVLHLLDAPVGLLEVRGLKGRVPTQQGVPGRGHVGLCHIPARSVTQQQLKQGSYWHLAGHTWPGVPLPAQVATLTSGHASSSQLFRATGMEPWGRGEGWQVKATLCHHRSHPHAASTAESRAGSPWAAAEPGAGCTEAAQRSLPKQTERQPPPATEIFPLFVRFMGQLSLL